MADIPEPWMFGVEVSVNDVRLGPGEIGKFTLLGRLRMKWRRLRGKPLMRGVPIEPTEETL